MVKFRTAAFVPFYKDEDGNDFTAEVRDCRNSSFYGATGGYHVINYGHLAARPEQRLAIAYECRGNLIAFPVILCFRANDESGYLGTSVVQTGKRHSLGDGIGTHGHAANSFGPRFADEFKEQGADQFG